MTELFDDLLDVSRVTRGPVELERKPVEIKGILGNAIEQVRPLIEMREHQLATLMRRLTRSWTLGSTPSCWISGPAVLRVGVEAVEGWRLRRGVLGPPKDPMGYIGIVSHTPPMCQAIHADILI